MQQRMAHHMACNPPSDTQPAVCGMDVETMHTHRRLNFICLWFHTAYARELIVEEGSKQGSAVLVEALGSAAPILCQHRHVSNTFCSRGFCKLCELRG